MCSSFSKAPTSRRSLKRRSSESAMPCAWCRSVPANARQPPLNADEPPSSAIFSRRRTLVPPSAASSAAATPARPPPTTTKSALRSRILSLHLHMRRAGRAEGLQLADQGREQILPVAHGAELGHVENRGGGIMVDSDDPGPAIDAGQVLDGPGEGDRDVD